MDLLYILTGVFISAIAISIVLGKLNGTLTVSYTHLTLPTILRV